MRTTIIPAQITTVEDKIVGNLTVKQMGILLLPVFWATIVFAIFPPSMHLAWYKLPLVMFVLLACLILAIRIKGKVVLEWLAILIRFNLRPAFYVFNKNTTYLRDVPVSTSRHEKKATLVKKEITIPAKSFNLKNLIELEQFIRNPKYSFSLRPDKKGGLYVAVAEIEK